MNESSETHEFVRQASGGDKDCMHKLLELTRPRLFAYLMRLTMDYHLAEDILQDIQTEMVTSLWRLNKASLFWPWIYKHAWGKVQHHYRDTRKHKTVFLSQMEKTFFAERFQSLDHHDAPCDDTQTEKLFETIYGAMKTIGLRQRTIIAMRCYEDMSFEEIGELLECSETNARVLFFRARNKLKKQLRRKGFRPGLMMLPALGLFGTMTSNTASAGVPAAAVSAASIELGFAYSALGFITTKTGILCSGVISAILAWLTITHLILLTVITVILVPVIFICFLCYVFND